MDKRSEQTSPKIYEATCMKMYSMYILAVMNSYCSWKRI